MISFSVIHEGQELTARAEIIDGVLWVNTAGRTFSLDLGGKTAGKKRFKANKEGGNTIDAPMPGKITKILKAEGQAVSRGENIIAMEAMKMEYTLKAEVDGVVKQINFKAGDQVTLGACLVEIETAARSE